MTMIFNLSIYRDESSMLLYFIILAAHTTRSSCLPLRATSAATWVLGRDSISKDIFTVDDDQITGISARETWPPAVILGQYAVIRKTIT